MELQSNENAALLKLLKSKSRTKTELLKVSSARRRARQAALDALLAEGKVIRIDREYFANDPSGSVEQLIDEEAARLDAYLRSVPDALARSGSKLRRAVKDNALASVALQRLLETGQVIELKYKKQRLCLHSAHLPQQGVVRPNRRYSVNGILQSIFRSASRRETLGKHSKGGRRDGGLKMDWTKPLPRAWPMWIECRLDLG